MSYNGPTKSLHTETPEDVLASTWIRESHKKDLPIQLAIQVLEILSQQPRRP